MTLTASSIAKSLGIDTPADLTPLSIILTDSRDLTYPPQTVFFALRTPGNDGHRYIPALIDRGVKYFVVADDSDVADQDGITFWRVGNVLEALQKLAADVRQMFPAVPVIGITGSRGKTVTKEMLNSELASTYRITRSPRSYNSQIGVPLSVWQLAADTNLAIFEAGISMPGEMDSLQAIIRPNIGVFTSLTDEHSENFDSLLDKAKEKAKLFADCPVVFYNAEHPEIGQALAAVCANADLRAISGGNKAISQAVEQYVREKWPVEQAEKEKGGNLADLEQKMTLRIDVCDTLKNCTIIYDGYTNDVRSVFDALNFLSRNASIEQKKTVILSRPDNWNPESEVALMRLLCAKGVNRLIAIDFGDMDFANAASCGIDIQSCPSVEDFIDKYTISDFCDEAILVKGDAYSGMENIKSWLEAPRHETVMEVDLGAVADNFNFYRSRVRKTTGLVAMVKADGYGAGAVNIAKLLQQQGASYLAVAVINEGVALRRAGITMPIMAMNPISTNYKALFDNKIEPSVFSLRELQLLIDNGKRLGVRDYPAHIKLDTGMHRVGFIQEELPELLQCLSRQNVVKVASIFSHLATADCLDQDAYTLSQLQAFDSMSSQIMQALPYTCKRHVLNTAGIMRYPEYQYDMVRLGIGLYGVSPIPMESKKLKVVSRLFTTIISIKHWPEGITIGYGRKGKLSRPSVIATLPIGYADGLDRHLSNGVGKFLVNGVECPVIGNICMDQCMIDVTDANAQIGDKVEIFGDRMAVENIADALGTIPYEIFTSVSPRVKRIYYRE